MTAKERLKSFDLKNDYKFTCKLTRSDKFALNHFVASYGANKFFLFGILPVNYKKWSSVKKLIDIIESMDINYSVVISKYSTCIYRVEGLAYLEIASSYQTPNNPFDRRNKATLILSAIIEFCKRHFILQQKNDELIWFDCFLSECYKKNDHAANT